MGRHLVSSTDCHACVSPGGVRDYLDPQFWESFVAALKLHIAFTD